MRPFAPNRYALLADIGGTNTRVALAEGATIRPDTIRRFRNAQHDSVSDVLAAYLSDMGGVDCAGVCVDLAGPVENGIGRMTNLNWVIDGAEVTKAAKAEKTIVINDMQAQAYAIPSLEIGPESCILAGTGDQPGAPRLILNLGTGFNAAVLLQTPAGAFVPASETGHAALPLRDAADLKLAQALRAAHGFAAIEDALSGRGLEQVYRYYAGASKPAQDILATREDDENAARTITHVCALLGAVAGDLALMHLPFGGIYLVGGVARALAPLARTGTFEQAFRDKGRFSEMMTRFSVHVVEDDYAALKGCALHLHGS